MSPYRYWWRCRLLGLLCQPACSCPLLTALDHALGSSLYPAPSEPRHKGSRLPLLDTISPPYCEARVPVRQRRWIVESYKARVKSRFVCREWRRGWGKKWLSSAASWCRVARLGRSLLARDG